MGAPLAAALGALHYLALFLQLGGATRPAGHAPWDNHVSGHGEFACRPHGLPHRTPPRPQTLQLGSYRARTCDHRGRGPGVPRRPPAGARDPPWSLSWPALLRRDPERIPALAPALGEPPPRARTLTRIHTPPRPYRCLQPRTHSATLTASHTHNSAHPLRASPRW